MSARKDRISDQPASREVDDSTVRDFVRRPALDPKVSAERSVQRAVSDKAHEVKSIISKLTNKA